jgi:hypothetical protein
VTRVPPNAMTRRGPGPGAATNEDRLFTGSDDWYYPFPENTVKRECFPRV